MQLSICNETIILGDILGDALSSMKCLHAQCLVTAGVSLKNCICAKYDSCSTGDLNEMWRCFASFLKEKKSESVASEEEAWLKYKQKNKNIPTCVLACPCSKRTDPAWHLYPVQQHPLSPHCKQLQLGAQENVLLCTYFGDNSQEPNKPGDGNYSCTIVAVKSDKKKTRASISSRKLSLYSVYLLV